MFKHVPNILTLIRLILSPLILPVLIAYLRPMNNNIINVMLAVLFILMNLTDFFDGYVARKYGYETKIGKLLDPIADKFLLFSSLIALVAINQIYFYWAIILIGREFFVMGLRIIALEHGFDVSVSTFGKLKTFLLTGYIMVNLLNSTLDAWVLTRWNVIEYILLSISLALSLFSAYLYLRFFIKKITIT